MGKLYFKNKQTDLQKKRSGLWLPEAWVGELDEGGQKRKTSSYKINKYWGCDVRAFLLGENPHIEGAGCES